MAFDNSKYDIELNGIPYRISGYTKSEAPSFVPRVGSSGQTESEFNMLLSKTLKGFSGGILQRNWADDQSLFASENLYPIYDDGSLYPVNTLATRTDLGSGRPVALAFAKTKDYLFIAWQSTTGGSNQGIKRIDTSGTVVSLTVPANISNQTYIIHDMVIWKNQLWVGASDGTNGGMYYMNLTATTLNAVPAGNGGLRSMVVFRDQLYGTSATLATANCDIVRYSGDTATINFTLLGKTPGQFASFGANMFVYNNRVILTRNDGMFAWDGIQLVTLVDMSQAVDDNNFLYPCVLKGILYYFMPDGMYRYTGTLIEKLYDSGEVGLPVDMCVGKERLWICYTNSAFSGSSRYDRSMGYDYATGNNVDGRIAAFNGTGMYTYARTSTFIKSGSPLLSGEGENDRVYWFNNKLFILTFAEPSNTQYTIDTNERAATGTKSWRFVTSIFDGDFPMIDKNIENVELVTDGNVSANENITVEYRTSGFEGSTGWTTLGTIQSINELKREVWKSIAAGLTFRKIQLRFSGTTTAGYGFAKMVIRYTLSPDFKWQWQFNVKNFGDDPLAPLQLADGSQSSQTVRDLRGNIYSSRSSDTPVKFVDIDQLDLNGAHNNSTTTITVNSTALLKGDNGFIKVDDEIMYWSAKTATQLTVTRAVLGSAAASHSDNAKVFILYRVLLHQIPREVITLPDNGRQVLEDVDLASDVTIVLREI